MIGTYVGSKKNGTLEGHPHSKMGALFAGEGIIGRVPLNVVGNVLDCQCAISYLHHVHVVCNGDIRSTLLRVSTGNLLCP